MSVLSRFPPGERWIETGLGHGQSLRAALASGVYQTCRSIEIDPQLVAHAIAGGPPVTPEMLYQGSSLDWLPLLCEPYRATVFWLDAHYSSGLYSSDSARDRALLDPRVGQCALLAELAIIRAVAWETPPIILIDDALCFTAPVYQAHHAEYSRADYPTVTEILHALPPGYGLLECDDGTGAFFVCEWGG